MAWCPLGTQSLPETMYCLRHQMLSLGCNHLTTVATTDPSASFGSWSKRPHSKTATPKTVTTFLATKTATTKMATLYWSKRPHREDHYQNGQTAFGQNGHTGRITTKTATLHLVKTATKGGSLQKRPHCIWSKRTQREDHYQNGHTAFGQNGHTGRGITGSLASHQSRTRVCLLACSRARF